MTDIEEVIKKLFPEKKNDKKGKPIASYKMTYDSQQAQLESIYYWLLDFLQDGDWDAKKIVDNFMSSPGSGHFAEMGQRATKMQEEGMKILGGLNQVIKSTLNLIYDLKEFELRLEHYKNAFSTDLKKKEAGNLALKQIWLDNVDIKRGRGSIHQMANEMGFATIRELFMMANSQKDLDKMNEERGWGIINDQVRRILVPRLEEFLKWKDYSYNELSKRMNIENNYLRSQVETIKLYSSWMKPYLKAAEELRQKGFEGNAALVNAFSTTMFELKLLSKKKEKVPEIFGDDYKLKRDYYSVIVIGMTYRGHVSQRVTQGGDQGFARGGRVDMTFSSYSLNEEELKLVEDELKKEDVAESMNFNGNIAEEALKELKEDLETFLKTDEEKEKEKKEKEKKTNSNPFSELFDGIKGFFDIFKKKEKKKEEIKDIKDIKKDNYVEKLVRAQASKNAAEGVYRVYDIYKKTHGMASSPLPFENEDESLTKEPEVKLRDVFKGREWH